MTATLTEHTQWQDESTGELINNGFVFFGDQNLDPVLNPLTGGIFSDRALTIALPNPQRTGPDGRTLNKVWLSGRYSIKVEDAGGVQKYQELDVGESETTGTTSLTNVQGTNTITADGVPTVDELINSQLYVFIPANTNTGPSTLQIDSTVAKDIQVNGQTLTGGDLKANITAVLAFNSAADQFDLISDVLIEIIDNPLDNSDFSSFQEGTSITSITTPANNDDTYVADIWTLLTDGNDVFDVSQNTTAADIQPGSFAGINLDVETVSKKGGIIQFIENKNVEALFKQGTGTVSLSFSASTSDAINYTLIRAAVLAWDSTADSLTSDVVSTWNVEGTNPTLVANWTFENIPVALDALTESVQRYKIENISLDTSGTTNLAVFIWMEDTTNGLGDIVTISGVRLDSGAVALPFVSRSFQEELYRIYRYLWRIDGGANEAISSGYVTTTTTAITTLIFPVEMRTTPTLSVQAATDFEVGHSNTTTATTAISLLQGGVKSGAPFATVASGLTADEGARIRFDTTAGGFFQLDARL